MKISLGIHRMKVVVGLVTQMLLCSWLCACTATQQSSALPSVQAPASPVAQPSHTIQKDTMVAVHHLGMARAAHTATLLANGTVLVTGGFVGNEQATASAELFDPSTRTFSPTSSLLVARQSHTATPLPSGKILIAGGLGAEYLASAELYDPQTGTFSATGAMKTARSGHIAILLNTGKVLIVGGVGRGWTFLASAELYDPQTGTFTATNPMLTPRESHTATRLPNGKVLVVGGHQGRRAALTIYASAELYDPSSGTWTSTGAMAVKRHKHDATLLPDGRVLISGGSDERDEQGAYTSTEIYAPQTGTFTPAASMHVGRYKHANTSVVIADGTVLLLGGADIAERYNPTTNTFTVLDHGVGVTRLFATTTILGNNNVLFAGGYGPRIAADNQAWVFQP